MVNFSTQASASMSLLDFRAYHILTYGALLGSNLFQTFLGGPVAYKALPRAGFSQLQQAIFPWFFSFQTVLPLALVLTWPGEKLVAVASDTVSVIRRNAGAQGLLGAARGEDSSFWSALVPMGIMFGTSLVNLVWLGPATTRVIQQRRHQETRDGKKYHDPGPKSPEMQRLNSSFTRLHSASSLLNVLGLVTQIAYGFALAEKL